MPVIQYGNRIKESSATTGTGSYTLAGAVPGFRTFDSDLDTGDTCYYVAEFGTNYEVGLGTFTATSTLARTTIFNSSNSDAAVNWGAGDKIISLTFPAEKINNPSITKDLTAGATLAAGDLCVMNASAKMILADADAASSSYGLMAICLEALSTDGVGAFLMYGEYTTTGLTAGTRYWISNTAGDWQSTRPTGTGQIVRLVGYSLSTTVLWFDPDKTWVTLS